MEKEEQVNSNNISNTDNIYSATNNISNAVDNEIQAALTVYPIKKADPALYFLIKCLYSVAREYCSLILSMLIFSAVIVIRALASSEILVDDFEAYRWVIEYFVTGEYLEAGFYVGALLGSIICFFSDKETKEKVLGIISIMLAFCISMTGMLFNSSQNSLYYITTLFVIFFCVFWVIEKSDILTEAITKTAIQASGDLQEETEKIEGK